MKLSILTSLSPQAPYKLHTQQRLNATILILHSGLEELPTYMAGHYEPLYAWFFLKEEVVDEDWGS
jgi:hypothetical protein